MLGPVLALLSSLTFGLADFAGGMLSKRLPAMAVIGWSQALILPPLLIALAFVGLPQSNGWIPWAIMAGVCGPIGLGLFYTALSIGTVGVVSPISALNAIIPVGLAVAAGEQPAPMQIAGIILGIGGAVLASGPDLRGGDAHKARAIWLSLGTAAAFGLAVHAMARGSQYSPLATMTGMRATGVTLLVCLALILRRTGGVRRSDLPGLFALGAGDISANLLLGTAVTMGLVSVTVVLGSLYPLVTAALAAVVLKERLTPVQYAGCLVAVAGVVLISVA